MAGTVRRRSLIPWIFPAAMLPILAANLALIYLALHSMPALVDSRPYQDGRAYNRDLAAAAAQATLGWSSEFEAPTAWGRPSPVGLVFRDRSGAPVRGLDVELWVRRPVGALPDQRLRLREAAPGRYASVVTLPLAGQWQFDVVARRGRDEFVFARRVVMR
jgi:nitrogen fixation protein FixH